MSKKFLGLCLSALAISSLLFVSCEKDPSEIVYYAPSLSLDPTAMVTSADGGSYSFSYSVSNPADDGEIIASGTTSWIEGVTDTGSGCTFTVRPNYGDMRTGMVSVTYRSSFGTLSETVVVVQNAGESPSLSVQPTTVTVGAEGGPATFECTIINPIDDGELGFEASGDWLYGFIYTPSKGEVRFNVDANETSSLRQADISVIYQSSGGIVEQTVTVIQDHKSDGGTDDGGTGGDYSDLVGTYAASGLCYVDAGVAGEKTWTVTIYAASDGVIIDGLVPSSAGLYPEIPAYIAKGLLNSSGQLVIPSQLTGYTHVDSGFFIGWTPCVSFSEGDGWHYSTQGPACTLTYSSSTNSWKSDYGEFLGLFSSATSPWSNFEGFFDVVNPGFTITKTSNSTSSLTTTEAVRHPIDENLVLHKDFLLAE